MIEHPLLASLCRISNFGDAPFDVRRLDKSQWATGDYVVGKVISKYNSTPIELYDGRMMVPMFGDHVVGAFGVRAATLEAVGHWNAIEADDRMHALTGACLIGKATSVSSFIRSPIELTYGGHCVRENNKVTMSDFVDAPSQSVGYDRPTILLIGTSMSSGKTTSAKVIIRQLVRTGLHVAGVKLTGAGRLRDTLAMRDAGAETIMDFVDAGLPSTVCPADEYKAALANLTAMLMAARPDVVVAEAGASPLEPYNGDTLMQEIRQQVCLTVLCASDPYAVLGVTQGFGFKPDLIAGLATSTTAGVEVIEKLTGVRALNLYDPESLPALQRILSEALGRRIA